MINFLKKLTSKAKFFLKNFIFLQNLVSQIVYFFLNIVKKMGINIYITNIEASRIGHLLNNIDQSIYYLNQKKISYILLIGLVGKVSNNFILSQWKKNKKIYFLNFFATKIVQFIFFNKKLKKFILGWDIIQPSFTKISSSKINFYIDKEINLTKEEIDILKGQFICLNNRDNKYTKDVVIDYNYLEYKNFSFEDFISTIIEIKKNNQTPIRIGNYVEKKYDNKKINFLDMSGEKSKDYMDILLQYYSKFTIIGLTGLSAVSAVLRKPILYINHTPFTLDQLSYAPQSSMIMPKLFFSKKEKRILKFSEMFKINFDLHQLENFLYKNDLEVIDNTKNEILDAYKEMNNFIDCGYHDEENYELNKKFFNLFQNKEKSDFLLNKNQLRIPTFFLKKNIDLWHE